MARSPALAVRPLLWSFQNPTLFVLFRRLEYRTPFLLDVTQTMVAVPVTILFAVALGKRLGPGLRAADRRHSGSL